MKVREILDAGDTAIPTNGVVLSIGPGLFRKLPQVQPGSQLKISIRSSPDLRGSSVAISGGPVLVRAGRPVPLPTPSSDGYEASSMFERHPRTAVGWNRQFFYFVEVDGRQRNLSAGMTLEEAASKTWTGQQAAAAGFKTVTVVDKVMVDGVYKSVQVVFTK